MQGHSRRQELRVHAISGDITYHPQTSALLQTSVPAIKWLRGQPLGWLDPVIFCGRGAVCKKNFPPAGLDLLAVYKSPCSQCLQTTAIAQSNGPIFHPGIFCLLLKLLLSPVSQTLVLKIYLDNQLFSNTVHILKLFKQFF